MNTENRLTSRPAEAVRAYNAVFGEMDRVLWRVSQECRSPLIEGRSSVVVETFVWTIKSWWGIQGVRSETKTQMAMALAELPWAAELFDEVPRVRDDAETFAVERVSDLVSKTGKHGALRREFSLASKALHWLLPWRIPVYDSFVRKQLGVPTGWDHPAAYSEIVQGMFRLARKVESKDTTLLYDIGPRSPLRVLDKWLWWRGGGEAGAAAVVKDPWRVVRQLGIR